MTTFGVGDLVEHASSKECGMVVQTWRDEHGDQDCYVVFYGKCFPPKPGTAMLPCSPPKPYVLRYYSTMLRHVSRKEVASQKRRCHACGKLTRETTAGCDFCDVEDK